MTTQKPTFTNDESHMALILMRKTPTSSSIYYELLEKAIERQIVAFENRTELVTDAALKLIKSLQEKVNNYLIDLEIEKLLTDKTGTSTQILSFKQAKVTKTAVVNRIIATLASSDMPLSRSEIAERTSLRVCSVTGRCAEMLKEGILELDEIKLDKDSNRYVQTLKLVK